MTKRAVIRYRGTLTRPARPGLGSGCPTCRRLGFLLTPSLYDMWRYYCPVCQQLFTGRVTCPARLELVFRSDTPRRRQPKPAAEDADEARRREGGGERGTVDV